MWKSLNFPSHSYVPNDLELLLKLQGMNRWSFSPIAHEGSNQTSPLMPIGIGFT